MLEVAKRHMPSRGLPKSTCTTARTDVSANERPTDKLAEVP
jgi:hypothetical protein